MPTRSIELNNSRYFLGAIFLLMAWVFGYSEGGSSNAFLQLFSLGMLSAASLLFGLSAITPLAIVAILGGVSLILCTPNPYAGQILAGVAGLLLSGVACHVGAFVQRKPDALRWMLTALVAAAFINALEGLLQWFGLVGELYHWVVEPEQRGTAFGALRQTNLFATFLCVGSVCTVWLLHRRWLSPSMAWSIVLFLMFAVAASGSRTGMLEVLALALLALFWRKHHRFSVTGLMAGQSLVLVLAMLILPVAARWHGFGFSSGLVRVAKTSQDGRFEIWSDTLHMIARHPWLGWGWREMSYGHYVTLFNHRFDGLLEHSHNLPLQIAFEFGLPLAILFFCGLLWIVYHVKPWRLDGRHEGAFNPASDKQFAWAILLLIVGIHSMLEYPLWYAGFLFITGVFLGYLLPASALVKFLPSYSVWSTRLARLTAVAMIGLSLVAWQQYTKVLLIYRVPFTGSLEQRRAASLSAIDGASGSWMFREHLDFALLGMTAVTPENAQEIRLRAEKLLHFSAEPRVIEPLLISLWYLNDTPALLFHAERFCRAFPAEFQRWRQIKANQPISHIVEHLPEACQAVMP